MKKLFSLMLVMLAIMMPMKLWAQEPYAVLSDNNTVLTFYYDDQKTARGGVDINNQLISPPVYSPYSSATTAIFDASFAAYRPVSTRCWFMECSSLTSITGMENLNTANVTDMSYMFYGCSKLISLDVSGFNTASVTDMGDMFRGCSKLTSLDVSGFNTASVTDMGYMFYGCSSLTSLDLSNFNTAFVRYMSSMFYDCSALTTIYVSGSWTTNATGKYVNGDAMFKNCRSLVGGKNTTYDANHVDKEYARIDEGTANPGYFTGKGVSVNEEPYVVLSEDNTVMTFYYDNHRIARNGMNVRSYGIDSNRPWHQQCDSIQTVVFDISFANCTTITSTANWFNGCRKLTSIVGLDLLNTDIVTDMSSMFFGCSSLTSIDVNGFNTAHVTRMSFMFQGCTSLTNVDVSGFKTDNVTAMNYLFDNCHALKRLDLSNFKTAKVTDMESMFESCTQLCTIRVGDGWSNESVKSGYYGNNLFKDCRKLIGGAGTAYNYNNIDISYAHIDGGKENPGYFTAKGAPEYPRPYAYLSEDKTVLTFCYDNQMIERDGMSIGPFDGYPNYQSWYKYRNTITTVVFEESFANSTPQTSTAYWFYECSNITSITGLGNLRTDSVTTMHRMFDGCSNLTNLEISHFNTAKVRDMRGMFRNCSKLISLDVSHFDTSNVQYFVGNSYYGGGMFAGCSSLTNLDVSNFNTANIVDMRGMFAGCSSLTSLDVSHFDTSKVQYMGGESYDGGGMFAGCSSLTSLDVSNFKTDNVTDMRGMFSGCSSLRSLDVSHFETSKVQYMGGIKSYENGMFEGCSGLASLDLSGFNTANVMGMGCMFSGCSGLTNLDLSGFNTANVTYMYAMFSGCSGLTNLDVSNFKTANVTSMSNMFRNCSNLTSLNVSGFNTDNVTAMNYMFDNCPSLTNLDVSNFKTDNVTSMSNMFRNCSNLTSLDLSGFNTANVKGMDCMFLDCSNLTSLDLSNFNTANVTNMEQMFQDCRSLTTIYVGNGWTTATVTTGDRMFDACTALVGGKGTVYDSNHTDHSYAHIDGGISNPGYFTGKNTSVATEPEPYAVLSEDSTMLTFYYDDQKTARGGMDIGPFSHDTDYQTWFSSTGSITKAVFDSSFANCTSITSTAYWFYECSKLSQIEGIGNLKTDNVRDMSGMFWNCSGLTNFDVSNFKTDNVTDMYSMFRACSALTSLDVSGFKTNNVRRMEGMFNNCSGLTTLDVNNFKTDNVMNMNGMFAGCSSLTSLDVSNFNTDNVTEMLAMFGSCSGLTTIYVGEGWSTANVTKGTDMFAGCTSLVGGAGTAYDGNHTDYTYAHIDGGTSNPGYFTDRNAQSPNGRRWDFTKWSDETIANLKADAATSKITGWSDVEKQADAEADAEPTETAKDNCFWLAAEDTKANGVAIAELEGLVFYTDYCSRRSLAIAVNYPSTSLGEYAGGAYLWLGGKGYDCFTIPNVKNGQTITIEVESHKPSEERGITLIAGSTELDSYTPTTKGAYSWTITEDCDVIVRNTNGCHIYTITVSGEGTPTDTLEIYAVETGSTITPNQPIMATQSVVVTPGNDVEWLTNMSMGSAWVNPLDFTSNIYYPGSTTTYTFEGSMRGTNNPKDGDIEDGVSTGSGYKPYLKNFPKSGGFLTFEVQQEGSLIVPIRVFAGKPLYVTDKTGTAKKDIQFKDASGQTLALQTNPLCAVSADEDVTGFVSFNVQPGEKYYVFSVGSKARFGGYVFSKQAIDIDPATMANVIDSLDALPITLEPYAVLTTDTTSVLSSDSTGVTYGKTLTFYYDNQKEARNGMSVGPFESSSERGWNSNADSITVVVFDDSFANCTTLTSTALWFSGCRNLKTIVGIENLKTDHVTTMFAMFDCCNSLTSLDVSKFNTENVTRMNDMFSDCRSLTSLDVTNFNTAKVTDMCDMFINCSSLTSLDVSNFKTDSVTNMSFMFIECSGLTSLDLSNFNTAKVTDMSKMFALCSGLTTIYVGNEWTTASVTDGTDMFKGCSAIKGGKGTTYSETFTIAYGNSTSSDYARIDYKGMPGYFTPKYGYTPEPTYTLEGNVLTIKAPIESSVYYVITDLYSGVDFESGDSLRIPETLYTGPLTLDHPVRVRFMAVNGRIAHSEIIVVKYKPIEATFDGRVLAVGGSTTMTDALESVGGRDEVAKTITAIVWNSSVALTNSDLQGLDNPNMLIYVNERSLAPENRNNVVVNGLAMNVVLSDTGSGNCDFYAPQTFTAEMITYSREFKQATQVGVCRGWETISLPFMVQTITHADNGVIAPFGVDTSNKHFWLRQLSTNGLVSATKIEANLPYLISMPNDEKNYAKEYILKGLVTFSAQNAVVPKTEPTALALADSSVVMMPALQSVGKSSTVWALNVGQERSQYFEGSTFERDYREVRPFEAYTVHRSDSPAPRFLPINDLMNSTTGIETISNVIMSHDNYYHIDGRKVDGKPTKKGLYITNGRKVVVK